MHVIDVSKLQQGINRVLDHIRASGVEDVPIEQGYYWTIIDDTFALDTTPGNFGVGDLASDLEYIESSLHPEDDPPALLLVGLASLLSYVGSRASDLQPVSPDRKLAT